MTCWAIIHKPTGMYMPQCGRGGTRIEVAAFVPLENIPRLFQSRAGAVQALRCWLMGPWESIKDWDYDEWSGRSFSYVSGGKPPKERPANRVASDMEVVALELAPAMIKGVAA